MFIFEILILGSFGLLNAVPRPNAHPRTCNTTDYCVPVPADFCDKSLCQPFDWDQIAPFGNAGVKIETWILGQTAYLGHCPHRFRIDPEIKYDGTHSFDLVISMDSGAYCNITYGTATMSFLGVPDPYTGKYESLTIVQAGEKYEACFIYLEPMVAYVFRTCRVDPLPENGQACGNLSAEKISTGDCNLEPFLKSLENLGYDFPQDIVQCALEHTVFFDAYA